MTFSLFVSYNQLAVYNCGLANPFNAWSDRHVEQGFAWRPGSVSFQIPGEPSQCRVSVTRKAFSQQEFPDATRIIKVPFEASQDGCVEVASVSDGAELSVEPGLYALYFVLSAGADECENEIELIFDSVADADFELVKTDENMTNVGELLLLAEPAVF